jgi:cytidine deaminase (EC 3.5.4.5)
MDAEIHDRLLQAAKEARKNAYARYSGMTVGAAVLTEDGQIYTGCNVENISYGATMCAERVAVFKAVSEGYDKIIAIAVVADLPNPISPCGMCLQVLNEFGRNATVLMANTTGDTRLSSVEKLLPNAFKPER